MDLFEKLLQEKDDIMLQSIQGEQIDFTNLRKTATEFSIQNDVELDVGGTDEELWKSVVRYFRELLRGSK